MQYWIFYVILILIILFLIIFWKRNLNLEKFRKKEYFFSISEFKFFQTLQLILEKNFWKKYLIFPKVRLADIFETDYQKNLNKIRAKHIDYLIIDTEKHYTPVLAIELNWPSHFSKKMKKSDIFKKQLFKNTWLPLIYFFNSEIEKREFIEKKCINELTLWNNDKFLESQEKEEKH